MLLIQYKITPFLRVSLLVKSINIHVVLSKHSSWKKEGWKRQPNYQWSLKHNEYNALKVSK